MRLTIKLVVWFIASVVIAVGLNGYFAVRGELERFETDLAARHVVMGRVLREAFSEVMDTDGESRAVSMLSYTDKRVHVDIRWVHLEPNAPIERRPQSPLEALAPLNVNREVHLKTNDGLLSFIPMRLEGRSLSALEFSEKIDRSAVIRHAVFHELRVIVGVVIGITIAAIVLGALLIGRPVRALTAQARRVGKGDLTLAPLPVGGTRLRDELAELAAEMNTMTTQLAEAQLAKTKALGQLQRAERLSTVGTLASGLAHELGTPLNVITLRAKAIAKGRATGDAAQEAAKSIAEQATRMTNLVKQLLDFARRRPPQRGLVDVARVIERTTDLVETVAVKAKVTLVMTDTPDELHVRGDGSQLEQVLTNLLINAIQASSPGSSVTVSASVREHIDPSPPAVEGTLPQRRTYVAIAVQDEGTGIAPETLPHIFEPFFTTKPIGEGTGLGLAVCYGIVRDHGGFIDVDSKVGRGTTLTTYLPVEKTAS